jgi:hypothetical protein
MTCEIRGRSSSEDKDEKHKAMDLVPKFPEFSIEIQSQAWSQWSYPSRQPMTAS